MGAHVYGRGWIALSSDCVTLHVMQSLKKKIWLVGFTCLGRSMWLPSPSPGVSCRMMGRDLTGGWELAETKLRRKLWQRQAILSSHDQWCYHCIPTVSGCCRTFFISLLHWCGISQLIWSDEKGTSYSWDPNNWNNIITVAVESSTNAAVKT